MRLEFSARLLKDEAKFVNWSIRHGHNPNAMNEIQCVKTVRYYICYMYGLPPESFEARKIAMELNLLDECQKNIDTVE